MVTWGLAIEVAVEHPQFKNSRSEWVLPEWPCDPLSSGLLFGWLGFFFPLLQPDSKCVWGPTGQAVMRAGLGGSLGCLCRWPQFILAVRGSSQYSLNNFSKLAENKETRVVSL